MKTLWIAYSIVAGLAGIIGLVGYSQAESAPQQAAAAGMALAVAVIPYLIVRAIQEASRAGAEEDATAHAPKVQQESEEVDTDTLRRAIQRR